MTASDAAIAAAATRAGELLRAMNVKRERLAATEGPEAVAAAAFVPGHVPQQEIAGMCAESRERAPEGTAA